MGYALLKQLRNSKSLLSHVVALTSGTVAAQAIAVLTAPVITRLYSPSDMGVLASLLAVAGIVGVVAAGRYDAAIVLPEKTEDALTLAVIGGLFAAGIGVILVVAFGIFGDRISPYVGLAVAPRIWTLSIGPIVFLIGAEQVLQRLHIRVRPFRTLAVTQVLQQSPGASIKIGFGLLRSGVSGPFLGTVVGHLVRTIGLASGVAKSYAIGPCFTSWVHFTAASQCAQTARKVSPRL